MCFTETNMCRISFHVCVVCTLSGVAFSQILCKLQPCFVQGNSYFFWGSDLGALQEIDNWLGKCREKIERSSVMMGTTKGVDPAEKGSK